MDVFRRNRMHCLFCGLCLGDSQPNRPGPRAHFGFSTGSEVMSLSFELQPFLEGSLLELRSLQALDFDALFAAASDPQIWEQHPQNTRYQKDVFQKYFNGAMESGGAFAILDRKSQEIVGSSRYYGLDLNKNLVLIGYTFLRKEYWGGLYNQDLKSTMLHHAFQYVDRVHFEVGETNTRSRRAMEKIGGRLVGANDLDGKKHVIFEIAKSEFKKNWESAKI